MLVETDANMENIATKNGLKVRRLLARQALRLVVMIFEGSVEEEIFFREGRSARKYVYPGLYCDCCASDDIADELGSVISI